MLQKYSQVIIREIAAAKSMLHEYGGIPYGKLKGFRAPFCKSQERLTFLCYHTNPFLCLVNYTAETLSNIQQQGFQYDTSSTATVDDCFW